MSKTTKTTTINNKSSNKGNDQFYVEVAITTEGDGGMSLTDSYKLEDIQPWSRIGQTGQPEQKNDGALFCNVSTVVDDEGNQGDITVEFTMPGHAIDDGEIVRDDGWEITVVVSFSASSDTAGDTAWSIVYVYVYDFNLDLSEEDPSEDDFSMDDSSMDDFSEE